jgi:hypothetical protein
MAYKTHSADVVATDDINESVMRWYTNKKSNNVQFVLTWDQDQLDYHKWR